MKNYLIHITLYFVFMIYSISVLFAQNKEEYIVTMIDDTTFKHYYWIKVHKLGDLNLQSSKNILSFKIEEEENNNNSEFKKIQIDSIYKLELTPMYRILDIYKGIDSVYLSPNFLGTIRKNNEVIISSDYEQHPFSAKEFHGGYYLIQENKNE